MKTAIIFDNDGTIVDTEPLHLKARQNICAEFGITLTKENYIKHWMSRPTLVGIQHTLPSMGPDKQEALVKTVLDEYHRLREEGLELIPGFRDLLKSLAARHFSFAVATVQPRKSVEHGLGMVLSEEEMSLFKAIVSGEDVRRNKPAPDVWLVAAAKLGLEPKVCVAVEDSEIGVTSAKAAGMFCIARASEWSPASVLYEAGADLICRDYKTLAEFLGQ
ncbi:MAG: hypothetical protein A2836_01895 [Candidatus Taylorbacteria bacterium RIFCSPHIGHO2_01_FULL_45_63]|uniref:HAD family hydrolase n=1 Tax=Candidatus Taylorbacteria bacterium RIFCSPHIGHO2_02_FULL_45_35 TaxID=1802311 RepID=A0A1G2MUY1_9BACT|nr:MAG: hypothetical protein A2836_01895 [Candidatus Taylorbacteria bacterium RIFCSPHIGHO2_01_FULL_45_63]OHA27663.1 MAG: hypothetical protein A3D56_00510 [Candidatus Taylorbacteria bacterium RIFCSPHIGHO2_02_FULL_45_35]OHA34784.1 MAG: hypothetical protein A3A22_02010 [Candidatus Taylorbacteria bacterium RIFCSPLOWO2_01_FULL_45_34b]